MGFVGYPRQAQSLQEQQAVLHGNQSVVRTVPQEGGGNIRGDLGFQGYQLPLLRGGFFSDDVVNGACVLILPGGDHRIGQDQPVGTTACRISEYAGDQVAAPEHAQACGKMPSGGKAADSDPIRVDVVLLCMAAHIADGCCKLQQGGRKWLMHHAVPQDECLDAVACKPHGNRFRFPVGAVFIAAPGTEDHGAVLLLTDLLAVVQGHGGEGGMQSCRIQPRFFIGDGERDGLYRHREPSFCMDGFQYSAECRKSQGNILHALCGIVTIVGLSNNFVL